MAEAHKLLATLDVEALYVGDADLLWGTHIDALRGLLLGKRGDSAAESVLRAAVKGFEGNAQTEEPLHCKVQQVLSATCGQKAGRRR
ncbi:MAG: hypothetical protein J0I77_01320 [Rudaea sp.]|uniref:hypothetical protein n=1 Tax=unclassified Rudaea TaxID=2627037 RepID=UPI0010F99EA9|nr:MULTISPECIES: hypothetical protein [unclassified Rudaea]MBN8884332.1 hypothetical protein [Rudaea sp.]